MEDTHIYLQITESALITLQDTDVLQEPIVLDMEIMFPCMEQLQFIYQPDVKRALEHFGTDLVHLLTTQMHGQILLDT